MRKKQPRPFCRKYGILAAHRLALDHPLRADDSARDLADEHAIAASLTSEGGTVLHVGPARMALAMPPSASGYSAVLPHPLIEGPHRPRITASG
jgi:hypothetical protein